MRIAKKVVWVFCSMVLVACGGGGGGGSGGGTPAPESAPEEEAQSIPLAQVTFPDPGLSDCVKVAAVDNDWEDNVDVTELACVDAGIESVAGIEQLTALTSLDLSINDLTEVDLSQNTALAELNLSDNFILAIDLSANEALENLNLSENELEAVALEMLTALERVDLRFNPLSGEAMVALDSLAQANGVVVVYDQVLPANFAAFFARDADSAFATPSSDFTSIIVSADETGVFLSGFVTRLRVSGESVTTRASFEPKPALLSNNLAYEDIEFTQGEVTLGYSILLRLNDTFQRVAYTVSTVVDGYHPIETPVGERLALLVYFNLQVPSFVPDVDGGPIPGMSLPVTLNHEVEVYLIEGVGAVRLINENGETVDTELMALVE